MNSNSHEKGRILLYFSFAALITIFFIPAFGQDDTYHQFADSRRFLSISNFLNVLSNLPFLVIGIAGVIWTCLKEKTEIKIHLLVFFIGILFTGLGSSYYHYTPNTATLVWDRLPMSISFMAFFTIIISQHVNNSKSLLLLSILVALGLSSVLYWHYSELQGAGDLRFYALVQFLPMVFIPLILFFSKKRNTKHIWYMLLMYALAKVCEAFDQQLFNQLQLVSGHTLKHFFAAAAPLIYLLGLVNKKRQASIH